jgi:hypothetical protein
LATRTGWRGVPLVEEPGRNASRPIGEQNQDRVHLRRFQGRGRALDRAAPI